MAKKAAAAKVEEQDPTQVEESEAEALETPAEPDAKDQEIARLTEENAALKAKPAYAPPLPSAKIQVTLADLEKLNAKEWEAVEEQTGRTRADVLSEFRSRETQRSNETVLAKLNVKEALDGVLEADPALAKVKAHVKEYLDDLPAEVKLDPERLKREVRKASAYARGVGGVKAPAAAAARPGGKMPKQPTPEGGITEDEEEGEEEGAVKPGAEVQIGKLRMKVSDKMTPAMRKATRHPSDANGVMFRDFDKAPTFARE